MSEGLTALKVRLNRISRLGEIGGLLGWDQQTYMPHGAAASRSEQASVLARLVHEMLTGDETGSLIANAEAEAAARTSAGDPPDSDTLRMLQLVRRDFDLATKLPSDLVAEITRHAALSHNTWMAARANNDFVSFIPALEKTFDLARRRAECLGYKEHIYDALIDQFEVGARQAYIAAMFADLKPSLIKLTREISTNGSPNDSGALHGSFPIDRQRALTLKLASAFGFDFNRGRQDEAAHPFCGGAGRSDVRLTTRFDAEYLGMALYATLHETGHGLYEQGLPEAFDQTPIGGAVSLGVHESQSRMWENLVGRSRPFFTFAYPIIQSEFPEQLAGVTADQFYRASNVVRPSLIRVEADEVTYNLHILLRFELECELLTGALAVKDLPAAWNDRMQTYLGITPPDDSDGVLQDVHWAEGLIGYFPTYALGNLVSGQLWHAISAQVPNLNDLISQGEFQPLLQWLRTNVHVHGRRYEPGELVRRATGETLTSKYYVEYLTTKYRDIYELGAV